MSLPELQPAFKIADHQIGGDAPCYVIAEAGANHNRDMGIAKGLIDAAADAGCDAVKFQTYSGEAIYSTKTPRSESLDALTKTRTASELLEDISLPRDWQGPLMEYAATRGIDWFSSPFDHEAIAELAELKVPAMKIASFELVDIHLIRAAAETGTPLILSTGMATMTDISDALRAAREGGATQVGLMECTSLYPTPPSLMNLRAMDTMRREFNVPVGLSDHTEGIGVAAAGAAMGAAFIEKHFTLDRSMEGPDHPFAVQPDELKAMVTGIREAQAALGDGLKDGPNEEESGDQYKLGRRSLIVVGDHPAGTELTREMITVKRPGFGIAPKELDSIVGRTFTQDVEHDDILTWELVKPGRE